MNLEPNSASRMVCPNCNALNAPRTLVCMSCGINMEEFRKALPRLEQIKSSQRAVHREQLEDESVSQMQSTVRTSRRTFWTLILLLMAGLFVVAAMVAIGSAVYANRVKQNQAEIQARYEASNACLEAHDFICARDGFQSLQANGADFPNLEDDLNRALFGLAQQYYHSGQWEAAVGELEELLQRDPGDQAAVALLKESYDRWIYQLSVEGKLFQRWMVRRERDARFPPGDK